MQFVGKYSFVKKDKTGNIIDTYSQNNVITDNGRSQIFKLLSQSSYIGFKGMDGYQALDLSAYTIQPVFSDNGSNSWRSDDDKIIAQLLPYDQSTDEYQSGQNFGAIKWNVQSSFFLKKKWDTDKAYPKPLKNVPIAQYIKGNANDVEVVKYQYKDINNNGEISDKIVDNLLKQDNSVLVNWKQINDDKNVNYRQYYNSLQNIDFFRVFCRQRIVSVSKTFSVPLWRGRISNESSKQMMVAYKIDLSQSNSNKVDGDNQTSVCLVGKYKNLGLNDSFRYFDLSNGDDLTVDIKNGVATITIGQRASDSQDSYQIILQYYVHYKDKRLDNGICGMYLYYDYLKYDSQKDDSQDTNTNQLRNRDFFGNGVFSANGGLSWDDNFCFPWCGRPIKYSDKIHILYNSTGNDDYRRYWNSDQIDLLVMSDNYDDSIRQRFFSFYPYVYKNPTQFQFLLSLRNSQIRVKNFVFLIPKFSPQVPSVFSFGDNDVEKESGVGSIAQVQDTELRNQLYRTQALQCVVDDSDSKISIKWKTVLQFEQANDFGIKQVGINYGSQFLKSLYQGKNWYYLKPIDIQQCNKLFSRVVLTNAVYKNDEQTLQVIYELQIG